MTRVTITSSFSSRKLWQAQSRRTVRQEKFTLVAAHQREPSNIQNVFRTVFGVTAAAAVLLSGGQAEATTTRVAEWAASGLIFKDSIELVSLDDQDVEGVTIYITDFKRSITEKLAKDFFAEPSQASLTCAITGPVNFKNPERIKGEGREIFAERKNLFNIIQNKTLRVRRVYDERNDTLLYIAYSTRFTSTQDEGVSTGRYRTSVCALPLATAPKVSIEAPSTNSVQAAPL